MNILPGNMRFGAGQPVKLPEDQRLRTGEGHFIADKTGRTGGRNPPQVVVLRKAEPRVSPAFRVTRQSECVSKRFGDGAIGPDRRKVENRKPRPGSFHGQSTSRAAASSRNHVTPRP